MTTTLSSLKKYSLCLAIVASFFCGCGNTPPEANGPGDDNLNTQNSTIEDPNWGTFELLAVGQDSETGKWDFLVRSSREVVKNQLRFVWDFGSGPEGEGLEQSYSFTENGTHVIKVTAYGADDSVAFVLKLTVEVGVDKNLAPIAEATSVEFAIENDLVFLYGGSSFDPDEDKISFKWDQIDGVPVQILHGDEASASFITPMIGEDDEVLRFRLTVSDGQLTGHSDVTVVVTDVLDPSDEGDPIDVDSDGDGVVDSEDECPNDSEKVAAGECGCGEAETPDCPARVDCFNSKAVWQNGTISAQNGKFEVIFNATPKAEFIDAVMGFSPDPATRFSEVAAIVRFNLSGNIDVRSGGSYSYDVDVPYVANVKYRFRLVIDTAGHTYDVFIRPDGLTEVQLASGFQFRTEQNTASALEYWNLWSDVASSVSMCNVRISAAPVSGNAGSDVTVSQGGSTPLNGSGVGGQAPYSYKWTPTTGLSNALIANPIATPAANTTYTLTVTDALGATDTDTVVVTVREPEPLKAIAGDDKQMVTGGSAKLDGSATGGTAPYTYKWSPATALSNALVASPTATPSATTTYTLTVTDDKNATATDTVLVTVSSVGTAFVVAQGASNASDSNPGTEAAPWKTLAKAASTAKAGQTVLVKAGTYNESLRPAYSGAAGNLITFKAFPGDACQGALGQPKVANSCKVDITKTINLGGRNYIRIEGFEIRNTGGTGVSSSDGWDASGFQTKGNQIVNNYIHHTDGDGSNGAIDAKNSDGLVAENNEIYETGDASGFHIGGQLSAKNLIARGNNMHRIGKDGFYGACANCLFEWNHMYDSVHTANHQDGFDLSWVNDSIFRYNTISDFTQLLYGGSYGAAHNWENLQIYGNVFFNDQYGEGPGIFVDQRVGNGDTKNIVIHSNTFGYLGYGAIWIMGGSNDVSGIKVYNNIFSHGSGMSIDGGSSSVTSDYNLFYNANKPNFEGTHSVVVNPQFMNYQGQGSSNFDFRLKSTSPAINKGAPDLGSKVTLPADFRDMAGQSRPLGGGYDMGSYEGG